MVNRDAIVSARDIAVTSSASLLGGKGANLAELQRIGQPVPAWFCVTTRAFDRTVRAASIDRFIADELAALTTASDAVVEAACRRIRDHIFAMEIPPPLREAIRTGHAELGDDDFPGRKLRQRLRRL